MQQSRGARSLPGLLPVSSLPNSLEAGKTQKSNLNLSVGYTGDLLQIVEGFYFAFHITRAVGKFLHRLQSQTNHRKRARKGAAYRTSCSPTHRQETERRSPMRTRSSRTSKNCSRHRRRQTQSIKVSTFCQVALNLLKTQLTTF